MLRFLFDEAREAFARLPRDVQASLILALLAGLAAFGICLVL